MSTTVSQSSAPRVARPLIGWFAKHARDLPWRRTLDPYAIWVSEIMLQQTRVATVIPYFDRWMTAAPDLAALARLSPTRLHKLWEGLGYYTRARNLQKAAARIITEHAGTFPGTFEEILALEGIGPYTAGAISSIAFNLPTPIVDGNVIRVLSRVYGMDANPKDKREAETFWQAARELVDAAGRMRSTTPPANRRLTFSGNCSMLNQSLMELGATVCLPKNPDCSRCPVRGTCVARKQNRIADLPRLPGRSRPTPRRFVAFIISNRNRFYVTQRPAGVVNAHLWEFPNVEVDFNAPDPVATALTQLGLGRFETKHVTTIKHSITRYRVHTECYRVTGDTQLTRENVQLVTRSTLGELPFTSAHRRLIDHI